MLPTPLTIHNYQPVLARTRTVHRPVGPVAYDCVKVIVVRSGSAILFSEFGQKPVNVGDVVILGANVLCGSEPEGHITVTTVYPDTDYVIDQVFWQHAGLLQRSKPRGSPRQCIPSRHRFSAWVRTGRGC